MSRWLERVTPRPKPPRVRRSDWRGAHSEPRRAEADGSGRHFGRGHLNAIVGGTPPGIGADAVVLRPLSPLDVSGSTCFAVLDRLADAQSAIPLLQAQLVVSGGAVVGNPQLRLPLDSVTVFLQRPTIYAPVALGILGGVIAGIVTLLRSSELAAYRFAGTSPRSLLIILTMEQMLMGACCSRPARQRHLCSRRT